MAFCEQCGNKLSEEAKFCSKCGNQVEVLQASELIEQSVNVCSKCGIQLDEGEAFCSNCGTKSEKAADTDVDKTVISKEVTNDNAEKESIDIESAKSLVKKRKSHVNKDELPVKKERHVITSIWLITCLVLSIIGIFYCVFELVTQETFEERAIASIIIDLIFFIVDCVVFIGFLNWSKAYFKMLCGASALYIFLSLRHTDIYKDVGALILEIVGLIVVIILTYLLLQLQKNGKSAWEQMSEKEMI